MLLRLRRRQPQLQRAIIVLLQRLMLGVLPTSRPEISGKILILAKEKQKTTAKLGKSVDIMNGTLLMETLKSMIETGIILVPQTLKLVK